MTPKHIIATGRAHNGRIIATYDIAMAAAKDAANQQAKANHRDCWSREDYDLACRVLADLYPQSGANPRAGLAKEAT